MMNDAKELYKKWHPDQFSDSTIIKKASLGRDFLEYHLSKISSHSQEKDFERFCKAILEVEICPNLLPQTGPTGGGDSKVDTETYPVAEQLTENWLCGYGNKSGSERWAFAISSKSDWKSKVKSDVEKIVRTNDKGRKYTKIFFISNQLISDKKRADMEDDLREKYGIDIRILSMDWLLDVVFKKDVNRQIAVKTLGLSENLVDEKRIGEKDYRRKQELIEIETVLRDISTLKSSEIIYYARRSVILSRELEISEQETLSRIDRYNRLAKEYGKLIDRADALYESAWTIYWWYHSTRRFYEYYLNFETIAVKERTTYLFEKLCTLWLNLFSIKMREQETAFDLDQHRQTIESIYEFLLSDENKPHTVLAARTSFQMIRIARGDSVDDIVNDYIDIVQKSENSLEVAIDIIAKMVQSVPVYQKATNYDQLFDLLVSRLSKEKHDSEVAKMNVMRGRQLIDSEPYKALSHFSKAVLCFYNEANKDSLMETIYWMGYLYLKLGLYWAARNYYYYVVTYCLNEYMKKGVITPFFAISANELKWIELLQGRVLFSSEMHLIELIAREAYPGTIPKDENNYDALFSFLLFKTPVNKLSHIGKLPKYLLRKGLYLSAIACRYELGYYDEDLLREYNGNKEEVDKYMKMWANQPAWNQIRYEPWYGFEEKCVLQSRIMGCNFIVHSDNDLFAIEFAITLLATLECFLGTGFHNKIISRASVFDIEIMKLNKPGFSIEIGYGNENPTYMSIKISEYCNPEFQNAHELLSRKLVEIISIIISAILSTNEDFLKLKEMIENEFVLARAAVFTDSLFHGFSTFGSKMFSYENLLNEYEEEPLVRKGKAILHEENASCETEEHKAEKVVYGKPSDFAPQQYNNDKIIMSDIINIPLWDISEWCGSYFLIYPNYPPILSLVFRNESGLKIFDEWKQKYGNDDKDNIIGIRIIKGISSENSYWYRIAIGDNSFYSKIHTQKDCVVINPCRMTTMHPQNDTNLTIFEQAFSRFGKFIICPSILRNENEQPEVYFDKQIHKLSGSIKICDAYEVSRNDLLASEAILANDNPYIPDGYEKSDLCDILRCKRSLSVQKEESD